MPLFAFRLFLAVYLIALLIYTFITVTNHGMNFFPVFFGEMAKMGWSGQFNFDSMGFLSLSALWVLWRHEFRVAGWVLGVMAIFGAMIFLTIYLLIHIQRTQGDMKKLLLGEARAHRI